MVPLLSAILRDTPKLDGLCKDRSALFDPAEPFEDSDDVSHRHEAARRLCENCGCRAACRNWVDSLGPSQRPAGVIAGRVSEAKPAQISFTFRTGAAS